MFTVELIAIVAPVSPRDLVNARMQPAISDEPMIGSRMRLKAANGFAPRVMATSSHSGLTSSMAPVRLRTTSGYVNEMCPRITSSRPRESSAPKLPQNSARENPSAVVGMMSGTFTRPSRIPASFPPRFLAMYSDSGIPSTTSTTTATPAIRNDVPIDENSIP